MSSFWSISTQAIHEGKRLITYFVRSRWFRYTAVLGLAVALTGCDSTPGPPADAPPSIQKDVPPVDAKGGGRAVKSIKVRPEIPPTPPVK